MTKEEFKERAKAIYDECKGFAGEEGHIDVDRLMEECLRDLGYEEGLDIIDKMTGFWYA